MTKAGISTFLSVCFLCFVSWSAGAAAQEVPTILHVDYDNAVQYVYDVADLSKLARSAGPVAASTPTNFYMNTAILDVTGINGTPAKGVVVFNGPVISLRTNPTPGQAIGDLLRGGCIQWAFEFLKPDGSPIGSLFGLGLSAGTPPPGSPLEAAAGNNAIVGGTGVFLGAKGSVNLLGTTNTLRIASQTEDPSMRRINGGGKGRYVLQIIPMSRPEVLVTTTGPVVFHEDYSPVTADKPAQRGETLIVYARNLGPTTPGVNPGEPFPADPLAIVTSPIEVMVGGKSSSAINQLGIPGMVDTYRVDFRVPADVAPGMSPIQLSAAWVKGPAVRISVK